jgi:hypothetical protein
MEQTMNEKTDKSDEGTIQAVLERLEKFRLPRAMAVKARVDAGGLLSDNDIQFLKQVFEDAQGAQAITARHPEYQALVVRVVALYDEITRKALENEQAKKGK